MKRLGRTTDTRTARGVRPNNRKKKVRRVQTNNSKKVTAMSSKKKAPEEWNRIRPPSSFRVADRKAVNESPFLDLPAHLQRLILESVPLRQLSQLACLKKELRGAHLERVSERDAVVAALLESHFTANFREGLSLAGTALPRDLVVDPPMNGLLQAAPEACMSLSQDWQRHGGQYQGFCIAGSPEGRGECRYSNGATYLGDWHQKKCHGRGNLVFPDSCVFVGEWCKGKRQGQGTCTWICGTKYEGPYHNNHPHGKGRYEWPCGDVYVGDFVRYVKRGVGRLTQANGESYFRGFENDKRDGQGIVTYPDGRKCVGCWKGGKLVQGRFT